MGYKLVVTGGTGFVGKNFEQYLKTLIYIYNVDVYFLNSYNFDLRRQNQVEHLYNDLQPDAIIHLAGSVGGIGANQLNPGKFMHDNLAMGMNLIEIGRKYGKLQKFIMVGTVCSYPKFTNVPFKEQDLWLGYPEETNAPYGIAKKTLMEMTIAYNKQYGFPAINIIPTNMYGPYDNFDLETSHVIPALIRKIDTAIKEKQEKITVWGTGEASRDFLYVGDFAEALMSAINTPNLDSQPINVGSGEEFKIKDVVNILCSMMDYHGYSEYVSTKPDGQPRRMLDINRAKSLLRFKPKTSLWDGLTKTVEYYRRTI